MIIGFHARNGDIGDHEDNGDVIAIGGTGGCGTERVGEKLSTVINNPSRHVKRKRKGKENFPPAPPIEKREGERKTDGEYYCSGNELL